MYQFWSFSSGFNLDSVRQAGDLGHTGLIPALVEVAGFSFEKSSDEVIHAALRKLSGEDLGGGFASVNAWYKWLGAHPEITPVEGYEGWKGQLYNQLAEGLGEFLYDGVPARVPTWAVQWGGVGRDGIPSLENPGFLPAADATYLDPDEIVLGLEVNGDARAYPKRVMNVHELANDVVGGRPVVIVL